MRRTSAVFVLAAAVFLLASAAVGQVPGTMNYQVMLTDDSDQPLSDQAVQLVFHIYNQEVGGSPIWTETHNVTTNSIGVVSVVLGTSNPIGMPFSTAYWLEVVVDGEIMSPRRELTAAAYAHNARRLDGVAAADYALDSDLSAVGTVNTPSNPVDWTMLKNVPAGFSDGIDDTGGVGDGYSLDADDGSPVDAVYVDSEGNVGIGVTTPQNRLTVSGSGSVAYGQFANNVTGYTAADGFEVGINGSGHGFINQQEALPLSVMTGGVLRARFDSDGTFELGSSVSSAQAEFYAAGTVNPCIQLNAVPSYGGEVELYEEDGDRYGFFEADVSGSGGFLWLNDGNDSGFFYVEGSGDGGNANMGISGASSSSFFDTSLTGDDAVTLPVSSVSSIEMFNEPGVVSTSGTAGISLTGAYQTLLSTSISTPGPGFVLAIGTVEVQTDHGGTTYSGCNFGVSNSSSAFPSGGQKYVRLPDTAGVGIYYYNVTSQWLFSAPSAGVQTFYFLADQVGGTWDAYDRNLTLIYFPTYYGLLAATVESHDDPEGTRDETGHALTEADFAVERAGAEAANNARVEAELAAMEARIAELRASMGNPNGR